MPYYPFITVAPTSGSLNTVSTTVDFGHATSGEQDESNIVTVSAAWVTAGSVLACTVVTEVSGGISGSSLDHDPEDGVVEGIIAYATNVVPGVSFDVQAFAPNQSWGRYTIDITGR